MKTSFGGIFGLRWLTVSVSLGSLLAASATVRAGSVNPAALLSPTALEQSAAQHAAASQPEGVLSVSDPALQAQLALSAANLANAAQALANMNAAEASASAASQLTLNNAPLQGSSWNGSVLSGLNPLDSNPTLWINADPLQKNTATATATVTQTSANAILTWQSLDLNKGETLVFDQQNHTDWTVLNRVLAGPSNADGSRFVASPTMILGTIKAPGSVYVIDPNGVIFGPTAQVNVHSLVASSLDVGSPQMTESERNSFFLNTGILGNGSVVPAESFSYNANDTTLQGNVIIDAGATITTTLAPVSVSPDSGGFVYLFAPNVENQGSISTPAGETLMVAAQAVQLIANAYPDGFPSAEAATAFPTFRAVGVNTTSTGQIANGPTVETTPIIWREDGPASGQISSPGEVTNTGLIEADRGVVILNGDYVTNGSPSGGGAIQADTSITRNGQIYLDARLQLTLYGGDIQILPDENGETIPQSAVANFTPGVVEMHGELVDFENGALVVAPGASVSVSTPQVQLGIYPGTIAQNIDINQSRIFMSDDSTIDVSGLDNVVLPMSDNFLTFKPFGNEFADQPLQRNGALRGQSLTVDLRQTGTLNGVPWVGTPLADLSGYVGSQQLTLDQLLTKGGNVSLSSPFGVAGQIVLMHGSVINTGGGYVQYQPGTISTTKLITSTGQIVDIADADPLLTYVGVAGITEDQHPHWGATTTQTFVDPLFSGEILEPGYIQGSNAGAINLAASAYVLDGTFYAGVEAGDLQRAQGLTPPPIASDSAAMPVAGSLALSGRNDLMISSQVAALNASFGANDTLPEEDVATTSISSSTLSDANFASISANFAGSLLVTSDATLEVVPGGSISLAGGSVDVEGDLVAHSGAIAVTSTAHVSGDLPTASNTTYQPTDPTSPDIFNLVVGANAVLDASGLWINDGGADPTALIGGAFINGGSITLQTDSRSASCATVACTSLAGLGRSVPANVDLTGDIVLTQGALLNVSSGGRITEQGKFQLDSSGRAAGIGGSVTLKTYVGLFPLDGDPPPPTTSALAATILLSASDGTAAQNAQALDHLIEANGFAQGGMLSLQAPAIEIGSAAPSTQGGFALPADFFDGNAFGAYNLSSVANGITVAPDATVVLSQRNLVPNSTLLTLPTGSNPVASANIGYLPNFLRAPVNLTLSAVLPVVPFAPYDPSVPVPPSVVALSIGDGAIITGDAGAAISLDVTGRTFWAGASSTGLGFTPPIAAQTAVAEVLGTISVPGGSIAVTGIFNSEIWLGSNSKLDVSGTALADPLQLLYSTGKVLPGGTLSLTADDPAGSIVGLSGTEINVSGSEAVFDIPSDQQSVAGAQQYVPTPVWSNAGSIMFSSPTLLYDGGYTAEPGAVGGKGGSLTIISPQTSGTGGTETINVLQDGTAVPAGLSPTDPLGALTGTAILFANSLTGSGIENLTIGMGPVLGDTFGLSQGKFAPGTLTFDGNVTISGLNQILVDASEISLAEVVAPTDPNGCNVCLEANYVALRGAGDPGKLVPQTGTGVLRIAGDTIDIAAGGYNTAGANDVLSLSGIAQANFVSDGDIRLRVPLANVPIDLTPGTLPTGELITAGNLVFEAAQIYPVSSVDVTLKSIAADGTIAFLSNGSPGAAPLSAGGQVTVSAANIVQDGHLLAPLGTIRLGAQTAGDLSLNDPTAGTFVPTQTVVFGPTSETSVSLNGQTIPYGQTANGTSWSYDSFSGQPLTAPPTKELDVSGAAVNVASGATINLSGGGDIQASEFVPGTGGTRNVLANNPNAFAIVPGYDPSAAPIDLNFLLQQGNAVPAPGSVVYLTGQGNLPAGNYTILPAYYATLPGAYLITPVTNTSGALASLNKTLPDGTQLVAGYFAEPADVTRDPLMQYFDVQSGSVWRQYSEIDMTSGNTFFGAKQSGSSSLPPPLPIDAAHAVFDAISSLNLAGTILSAPGTGGRGSEFDIAAQDIQVLSPGGTALSGYVGLDATQLSDLGVDSLLLGGVRSDTMSGEAITAVADSVMISNDAGSPLEAPEIILTTQVGSQKTDPNALNALTLAPGSVIEAKGAMADPGPLTVTIGNTQANIRGNGSLLAVSTGMPLTVVRQNAKQANGSITLAGSIPGSNVAGTVVEGASLTLATSGKITTGAGTTITANDISIAAKSINFGTPQKSAGLNINGDLLTQLEQTATLSLASNTQEIDFTGDVDFALSSSNSHLILNSAELVATSGGTITLAAREVDLANLGAAAKSAANGTAVLDINAADIEIDGGNKALSGFSAVTLTGSSRIAVRDAGSLDPGAADLAFETPLFLVGGGANQSVTTAGAVSFTNSGSAAPTNADEIGGVFSIDAGSIALGGNALIQATAGNVALTATTGDITLDQGATILANGFIQTFFDTTRAAGGGAVELISQQGSIYTSSKSTIDVSSPAGELGYAGSITFSAPNGNLLSDGAAFDMSVIAGSLAGDSGGRLTIDAQSIGTSVLEIPAMFSRSVDVHLRQGDLQLGSEIKAANVSITDDGGTLTIDQTIDASGTGGGTISLYGLGGVVLDSSGSLLATASDPSQSGGVVAIGTEGQGVIDLAGGTIDVANTSDVAKGGTIKLRAPLLAPTYNDVAVDQVQSTIVGATSFTVEGFHVFDTHNSAFNGIIDPVAQPNFYGQCNNTGVCSGTLIDFVQNFSLSPSAIAKFASIPADILHLQPGIELVNDDPSVNSGNITVANAWNLGAGFAGYLVNATVYAPKKLPSVPAGTVMTDAYGNLLPQYSGYKGALVFESGVSRITSLDYRVGGAVTGEAGTLTLRAVGNVDVNASITDGFFSVANEFNSNYQKALTNWVNSEYSFGAASTDISNVGGYLIAGATFITAAAGPIPLAPYDPNANAISPIFSSQDKAPITGADLFPLIADPSGNISGSDGTNYTAIESWSYRIAAGADTASANPLSLLPLSTFVSGPNPQLVGEGSVILSGHQQYSVLDANTSQEVTYETPTIIRTGTGSIDIAAGLNFVLADTKAPGVVYTAGRSNIELPDPGFALQTVADPLNPGQQLQIPVATNPEGFLDPLLINCDEANYCNPYGPLTQAAYPVDAGNLTLVAQQDILGFEHPTINSPGNGNGFPNQQYFAPWLLAEDTPLSSTDFGPFSPLSGYVSTGGLLFTPSQTSWWINFGSFDQGLMSVGGNIFVEAGRDIQQLSVSAPTTARVSGGLSSTIVDASGRAVANVPVMHLDPSGNITVIAGRNLTSGAYYEGSGHANIEVGGSISASWAIPESPSTPTISTHPVSTILALDTGTIDVVTRGSADIGGIVSGPSLQNVADPTGALNVTSQSVSSYGPSSGVSIISVDGDVTDNTLSFGPALTYNIIQIIDQPDISNYPSINRYPANFEAVALNGNVDIEDSLQLAPSQNGSLDLLAYDSIFTYNTLTSGGESRPISTGPSLIEAAFDAAEPLAGFGPSTDSLSFDLGAVLLHQDDSNPDLFYAATGDIVARDPSLTSDSRPLAWEVTKPAKVEAAGDIVDLSFFGQNLAPTDVTSIVAGRDIYYTGAWQHQLGIMTGVPDLQATENLGGLSLAGPGYFDVEAGRNLGPFVTAAADITASLAGGPVSDPIGTGIITFGNNVVVGNRRMFSDQNAADPDPFALGTDNELPRRGADIVALFGVGPGVDYQAVIKNYIDPTTSTSARNYLPNLVTFLETLGYAPMSTANAWQTFGTLPADLQHIFVDQVFMSEIEVPGDVSGCCYKDYSIAYSMINTLFLTSLGYTNDLVSGNSAPTPVVTGQLDLLHATIKTLQSATLSIEGADGTTSTLPAGGDIMVFGPGGSINVGTTATEINPKLSNSSLGILTLDDGAIDIFTDGSVLVNQSRILTVEGGDILMWSSNGNLDAGRGAKTTVDFKPLSVNFSPSDLQTINLFGLVSGAGIGTIQSTPDAPAASAFLIAPHGTVNAGDAGLRSSGNLNIVALLVLNAANISVVGTVSGVPQVNAVNLGSLESASASGGQAAKVVADSVAAVTNRASSTPQALPSLITVEVIGFGDCDPESGKKCPS